MTLAIPHASGAPSLVLASRSPRRRALLHEAGIPFRSVDGPVDDGGLRPGRVPPEHWVVSLAYLKARAVAEAMPPGDRVVVLGADTVCVADGEILGQPNNEEVAAAMLRSFIDTSHAVVTGVALVEPSGGRELLVDSAAVTWGVVPDEALRGYLASGGWRGKAGGYNLAERLDAGWPIVVDGDPGTVMGLPMRTLPAMLRRWRVPLGVSA
ncbi:MAG: Maf family protein [Phycisphaerales bacterium]